MVEDVALNVLVFYPCVVGGKDVDFDGDAVFGGLELSHEQGFLIGDFRMIFEILADVGAECSEVAECAGVDAVG